MVHSVQTVHLSCAKTNTIAKQTETGFHLGVPSGVLKVISIPVVHSAQTVHLSCVEIRTISKHIKMSFHLIHVTKEYNHVRPK
jgi:hypothetical protein